MTEVLAILILLTVLAAVITVATPNLLYSVISLGAVGFLLAIVFLFLAAPTFLMGLTLPLLTKIFNQWIRQFLESVSLLYFLNTLGAACGALVASYGLISFWGLDGAVYTAAGINLLLVGLIAWAGRLSPPEGARPEPSPASAPDPAAVLDVLRQFWTTPTRTEGWAGTRLHLEVDDEGRAVCPMSAPYRWREIVDKAERRWPQGSAAASSMPFRTLGRLRQRISP